MVAGWVFGLAILAAVVLALAAESWWRRHQDWKRLTKATGTEIPRRYSDEEIDAIIARYNPVRNRDEFPKPMMRP